MRILMVCDDVQIDRRVLQQAESLITNGHEVILLARHEGELPTHERLGNVKVERVKLPFPYEGKRAVLVVKALNLVRGLVQRVFNKLVALVNLPRRGLLWGLDKFQGLCIRAVGKTYRVAPCAEQYLVERVAYYDPDCVHVHDLPQLRVGALAKRQLGVPLIYDAHELYPEIITLTPAERTQLDERERKFIGEANAVTTVNPFLADEMARRYAIPAPDVILNAVNAPEDFDPRARHDRFRQRLGIPADQRILLYQGWFALHRGLLDLVTGMANVAPHVHLVMMGYGDDALRVLRRKISTLGIEKRVHILPAVPQHELLYWTASADVGIIPYPPVDLNNHFCSPNKLFEFIQAGLPILANDLPFLRRMVDGEKIGLVWKLDSARGFTEAINQAFQSDDQLRAIKRRLLEVRDQYSWTTESAKLLAIYDRVFPAHARAA